MAKQIFFRVQVSASEKAEIERRLAAEFNNESFSNVVRELLGYKKLSSRGAPRGNNNATSNFGKAAKILQSKLSTGDAPDVIERRFMDLLAAINDPDSFNLELQEFLQLFDEYGVNLNKAVMKADIEKLMSGHPETKRRWSAGFWG